MERKFTGERLEANVYNSNTVQHLHRYAIVSEYIENKIVLDIASGEGYGSNLMSKYASFVYGVDIDSETINHAQKTYIRNNLNFLEGSTSNIPLKDNSVDVVVSFETIEHHDEHSRMFEEIKRVLRPNGILIISTPDKYYYSELPNYQNPFHVKELYKEEFMALIKDYFSKIQLLGQSYSNRNSLIFDLETDNIITYAGDFSKIKKVPHNPIFLIGLASNSVFELQKNSIFEGADILKKSKDSSANFILNSTTYRVGNMVLLPFKIIKRILNSF